VLAELLDVSDSQRQDDPEVHTLSAL
jgi:hypothetical protein